MNYNNQGGQDDFNLQDYYGTGKQQSSNSNQQPGYSDGVEFDTADFYGTKKTQ